jgi:hypothetical protein
MPPPDFWLKAFVLRLGASYALPHPIELADTVHVATIGDRTLGLSSHRAA